MIRLAKESDLAAILSAYDEIIAEEEAGKIKIGWRRGVYPTEATLRAVYDKGELYVIDIDGITAASFAMNREHSPIWDELGLADIGDYLVLHTPVVARSMGGRGLGSEIVRFYEDFARRNGFSALRLDTNADNIPMRRLYAKAGFTEVAKTVCTYNGIDGIKLVVLEKLLDTELNHENK